MKKILLGIFWVLPIVLTYSQNKEAYYSQKADSILLLMTLDEKVGQLNMLTGNWEATGPVLQDVNKAENIKSGRIGSMLNVKGSKNTRELQELALSSRTGIPLLFGQDVIHGYKTILPIPLAQASSFDRQAIELASRTAALESAVSGIHWLFSPMLDVSSDPRWGRVMEGPGEDPYWASEIAKAMIKGYQDPIDGLQLMACAKHFAAYSGAIGGRDYNTVDVSLQTLNNIYLPPFKAATESGIASFMCAFNEINGVPATANSYLYDLLYKDWGFKGLVVSDWGSIGEMVVHGYSKDRKMAAKQAFKAGVTIDMESYCYIDYLKSLIEEGEITEDALNSAVKQVLIQKIKLGLFEDPFKYCNEDRENEILLSVENRKAALDVARKSIILLKNDDAILPLQIPKKILVVGPLANSKRDMDGNWVMLSNDTDAVTLLEALKKKYPNSEVSFIEGCKTTGEDRAQFEKTVDAAKRVDLVILALGETWDMSGEAKSKGDIQLPGVQEELACKIYDVNKHTLTILMGGRPMIFNRIVEKAPAIIYAWWLGTEAGNAIVDVITGVYNPSGRVPMSFPKHLGQIPVYYNHKNSGRPPVEAEGNYSGRYIDIDYKPQYPFAFGLSYTSFDYKDILVNKENNGIAVSLSLSNTGGYDGKELVQVYVQKLWGESTRPVKELKACEQIFVKKGENQQVKIFIPYKSLEYYGQDGWVEGQGDYRLYIGRNASDVLYQTSFTF